MLFSEARKKTDKDSVRSFFFRSYLIGVVADRAGFVAVAAPALPEAEAAAGAVAIRRR